MELKLYSREWCSWCMDAKDYLNERGYRFAEIDVGAILAEKLLLLRRPEHHGARVHAGVGDDHFRRRCPMRVNRSKRKETDGGAEND